MSAGIQVEGFFGLFGIFDMKVFDIRSGKRVRVRHIHKRNQITNQGRTALLDLMRPETVAPPPPATDPDDLQRIRKIWSLSAGTNATLPTINDDDTTMAQVWRSQFFPFTECQVVIVSPNQYYLQIGKILPVGAVIGEILAEAGVFTRGDNDDPGVSVGRMLYARQTHSPIIKTGTMTIEYDWKLGISIQGS